MVLSANVAEIVAPAIFRQAQPQ